MKILALILGTCRELAAKATLYVLVAMSSLILLGVAASVSSTSAAEGRVLVIFGNPVSPPVSEDAFADVVSKIEAGLASGLFLGVVLFGMFATAGVLPDALERGTVDLYLSKPIARWELLCGKYLGGVAAIFANILYFIGALWLILGLKLGVWTISFLTAALLLTLSFACLYAVVNCFGVLSRNIAIAIIGGFVYLFIVAEILQRRETTLYLLSGNAVYRAALDGLFYMFPQIPAMQMNVLKFIGGEALDWRPFAQSILSSSGILVLTAWILHRKDF